MVFGFKRGDSKQAYEGRDLQTKLFHIRSRWTRRSSPGTDEV